jgi:hypothetical protein
MQTQMVERTELANSDHEFARFLRAAKAIDNCHTVANSTTWYGPAGNVVTTAIYDNAKCEYKVFTPC